MVTIMPALDTLEARRHEALERLSRQYPHYVAERDDVGGGHIVRNVNIPGRLTLVSIDGECSCRQGLVFGICRHLAAVESL